MHKRTIAFACCNLSILSTTFGFSPPVLADQVRLTNGDQISGSITALAEGSLTIQTAYAGLLTINLNAVQSLETDQPQFWRIDSNTQSTKLQFSEKAGHVTTAGATYPLTKLALEKPSSTWKKSGRLEGAMDIDNDSERKEKQHFYTELDLESNDWRHELKAETKRDKSHNRVTEDTLETNYRVDYLFNSHWFVRSASSYRIEGVELETSYWNTGIGPGYRLWGQRKDKLDVIVTYNRFGLKAGPLNWHFSAYALNLDYQQFWFNEHLETFVDVEMAIPNIDWVDYLANTSSGIRYYLSHNIHLSLKYDFNETHMDAGTTQDSSYTLGAGVSF